MILVVNELPNAFGVDIEGTRSAVMKIKTLFVKKNHKDPFIFLTFTVGTLLLYYLLKIRKSGYPWHALYFICGLIASYFTTDIPLKSSLGISWYDHKHLESSFKGFLKNGLYSQLDNYGILAEPNFMLNCIMMSIITLLESTITMKLSEHDLKKKSKRRVEILGIAITNFLCSFLGLFPVSLPIGRNLLAIQSGASHYSYLLFSSLLTIFLGYVIWPYLVYLPLVVVSIFNACLGLCLIDFKMLRNYWYCSPRYATVIYFIIVASLFVDLVFTMIYSWLIFLAIYTYGSSEETYVIGDIEEFCQKIKINKEREDEDERFIQDDDFIVNIREKGILYKLEGKFNFLFYRTHLKNIEYKEKEIVILDFRDIVNDDIEFIQEYYAFIYKLMEKGFNVYITGIEEKRIKYDGFLIDTWISEFFNKGKILFE